MFPSTSLAISNEDTSKGNDTDQWLQNASYCTTTIEKPKEKEISPLNTVVSDKIKSPKLKKKKREKKSKKEKVEKKKVKELLITKVFLEEIPGLKQEDAHRIDRHPDHTIRTYGSLSNKHIAKYRPSVFSVLGMKRNYNPYPMDNKPKLKELRKLRYFSKENRRSLCKQTYAYDLSKNSVLRKQSSDVLPNFILLPMNIDEKGTSDSIKLPENKFGIRINERCDAEILRLVAEYNRTLAANPKDVDTWMQLIDLQPQGAAFLADAASCLSSSSQTNSARSKVNDNVVAEKQRSILSRALASNPSNLRLIMRQLELGEQYDWPGCLQTWNQVVFSYSEKADVWRRYLRFICHRAVGFSVSKVSAAFVKCFTTLNKILSGKMVSHRHPVDLSNSLLVIFVDYCRWLRASGLVERALGSWQALIEFSLFRPDPESGLATAGGLRTDPMVLLFERFWESGVARFGEPGALGWSRCEEAAGLTGTNSLRRKMYAGLEEKAHQDEDSLLSKISISTHLCLSLEKSRDLHHWLPWQRSSHSATESEEKEAEDPDRVVLFDDIFPCLLDLRGQLTEKEWIRLQQRMILLFLDFLGLRNRQVAEEYCLPKDDVIIADMEEVESFRDAHELITMSDALTNHPEDTSYSCFVDEVISQSQTLFDSRWRAAISGIELGRLARRSDVKAMSSTGQVKLLTKRGREILSREHCRLDLSVWCDYARLLWRAGGMKEARRVLDTALTMHPIPLADTWRIPAAADVGPDCDEALILVQRLELVKTYIDLELTSSETTNEQQSRTLRLVTYAALGGSFQPLSTSLATTSGLASLKTRHCLAKFCQTLQDCGDDLRATGVVCRLTVLVGFMYALFKLLTEGEQAMMTVLLSTRSSLNFPATTPSSSPQQQKLLTHYRQFSCWSASLLDWQASTTQQGPRIRHTFVTETLHQWPNLRCPRLLAWLLPPLHPGASTPPLVVLATLRRWLEPALGDGEGDLSVWSLLLVVEMARWRGVMAMGAVYTNFQADETGASHRIRALFERGIKSVTGHMFPSQCIVWWRAYLTFEGILLRLQVQSRSQRELDDSSVSPRIPRLDSESSSSGVKDTAIRQQRQRIMGIFYRAVQACPWAKCLYFVTIQHLPENIQEILDIMTEREIRIRAPLEEVEILLQSKE